MNYISFGGLSFDISSAIRVRDAIQIQLYPSITNGKVYTLVYIYGNKEFLKNIKEQLNYLKLKEIKDINIIDNSINIYISFAVEKSFIYIK